MGFVGNEEQRSVCGRDAPVRVETGSGREGGQGSDHRGRDRERERESRLREQPVEVPPHCMYAERIGSLSAKQVDSQIDRRLITTS